MPNCLPTVLKNYAETVGEEMSFISSMARNSVPAESDHWLQTLLSISGFVTGSTGTAVNANTVLVFGMPNQATS